MRIHIENIPTQGSQKVESSAPLLAFFTSSRMMHLMVNTYGSANTTLEDVGTTRTVFICSSRIMSKRIRQALVSAHSYDIFAKTL